MNKVAAIDADITTKSVVYRKPESY